MKIIRLKLENFRAYYGEQEIEFSMDEKKNLTLCLGKNNAGKTSLAQSIVWCLYGHANLKEPDEMLNKAVKYSMVDGDSRRVAVTLEILHQGKMYIILREQEVHKTRTGYRKDDSKQTIMTFDGNNQIKDVSDTDIREVLPRALSRFFIFDGERMLHMGRNDSIHRDELETDIRSILGLDALEQAISHLGGWNNSGGLLLALANKIDNGNDEEISNIQQEIKELSESIETYDKQMIENINLKKEKELELSGISDFLEENEHVKQNQIERAQLEIELATLEGRKEKAEKNVLKKFSSAFPKLLLQRFFDDTIEFVSESADLGEAAPGVTANTIDFLLEKGECICGTEFNENDKVYNSLMESKKIYPPESIGNVTTRYLDSLKSTAKSNEEFSEQYEDDFEEYLKIDGDILNKSGKLDRISRKIQSSTEEKVKEANIRYNQLTDELKELKENYIEMKTLKVVYEKELEDKQETLSKLSNKNEQNVKITNYRNITKEILELLKQTYNQQEDKVRKNLQNEVQNVYSTINRGKGKIEITDKFDFNIYSEINGKMYPDDSKGQGLSTVAAFAFVCGITKLVRDKIRDEKNYGNEPYPLIIDAPYSMMDTGYIESVSETLPKYAEQLIIFVKDDNFETARKVFEKHGTIGKEYRIELEKYEDGNENQLKTKIY